MTRISELLQNHRIQARRLQRVFLEEIGVTAKIYCRIARFNHAKSTIENNPEIDLRKLAYECGYADQSHFTRNFREMFGITPADFKARMRGAAQTISRAKTGCRFPSRRSITAWLISHQNHTRPRRLAKGESQ